MAQTSYSDNEIDWLLGHIGDEDPAVRDDTVYIAFCNGFINAAFTVEQARHIAATIIERNLLTYRMDERLPATVTRTFAALACALLIGFDGTADSKFSGFLNDPQRAYLFESSWRYLMLEHDFTGYSAQYGWVHAFAHGADFLAEAIAHPRFPTTYAPQVLSCIDAILHRLPSPFRDGEEQRLAQVIVTGINPAQAGRRSQGVLGQNQVSQWIQQVTNDFAAEDKRNRCDTRENTLNFERSQSFTTLLAYAYAGLSPWKGLEPELSDALLKAIRQH